MNAVLTGLGSITIVNNNHILIFVQLQLQLHFFQKVQLQLQLH